MSTTADLPYPVAYVATDALPPHRALYGTGETRQGALEDARRHRTHDSDRAFRILRATARLAEAVATARQSHIWSIYQDSHGDYADLAGPDGERLPAAQE